MKQTRHPPTATPETPTLRTLQQTPEWFELWAQNGFGLLLQEHGLILDANPTVTTLFGYERSELVGRSLLQLTAPRDRSRLEQDIRSGSDHHYEIQGLRKDGRTFPAEVQGRTCVHEGRRLHLTLLRDLSEFKRAELAAREAEARYQALAEAAHDMIFVIGRDGTVQYVNSFAASFLGLRPEDIIGQPRSRFFPAPARDTQEEALRRVFESGEHYYAEEPTPFPGRDLWLGTWLSPLRNASGEVVAVQGISRDITNRIRTEEALRLQSLALNSAANGIVITDRQGIVVWVNPAFGRLTGYADNEILGRNLSLLKSGCHPPEFYRAMWEAIVSGRVWQAEVINRRKDGTLYTQEQTITPVRGAQGEITHFIAIQQDITDRKRMEDELLQSRERFARIFRFNPAALAITSAQTRQFMDVNDGFLEALGFSREEVIGRSAEELDLFAEVADLQRMREGLEKDGRLRNFETRFRGKNGKVYDVLLSVEPIQLGSQPCLLAMANDITRWKQQQAEMAEKLRRAAKLESIGTLAGGIAHDFNNILTVIQGHTHLLLDSSAFAADNLESLQQIKQASERAANLTRQLLTFSRLQPLERRPLDLNQVVGHMTKMLCRIIGEDITLEIRCASQAPVVLGDVGMMEQLLMNLAVNARDAIHAGRQPGRQGRLLITTESVTAQPPQAGDLDPSPAREYVRLSVQDNGCGIPPEVQNRIYDPFFTTKEVGKGTGLGLATVHGIVHEHHGWIDLESQVGAGTTFRIYLPAHRPEEVREETLPAALAAARGHETVLLVEDEEPVRNLARDILERYGYTVLCAVSGREALELWERHPSQIALLLTDEVMPEGMSGRQLAETLQARQPGLKVILSTGYSSEPVQPGASDTLSACHLRKPYPPHELAEAVRRCLDQRPQPPKHQTQPEGERH